MIHIIWSHHSSTNNQIFFTWKIPFVLFNNSFQILLPQWNNLLNIVTCNLISSYILFESCEISNSILNMFHLFGYRSPCTKMSRFWMQECLFLIHNIDTIISDPSLTPPPFFVHYTLINYHKNSLGILNISYCVIITIPPCSCAVV